MADRILITGAAGTLGRATIPRLVEAGYDVLAGDVRTIDGVPRGVVTIDLDVRDGAARQGGHAWSRRRPARGGVARDPPP